MKMDLAILAIVNLETASDLIQEVIRKVSNASSQGKVWFLIHTDFKVEIGSADSYGIYSVVDINELFDPNYLQELRLFGAQGEWHVWHYRDKFYARLLNDITISSENYIEEYQALLGTKIEANTPTGWTTLKEDRGGELHLPHLISKVSNEERLLLQVRHYIGIDAVTHLATILDSRLVALCNNQKKSLDW